MKITVINNRPVGGEPIYLPDGTSVARTNTKVMTGRTNVELAEMIGKYSAEGHDVIVFGELEGVDREPVICNMKHPADPAGGATTCAAVGFDLVNASGTDANVQPQMWLGVFTDAACTTPPATSGTLATAAKGTIDAGSGTHLIKITPDATGEASVTLTNTQETGLYIKAWPVGTNYTVDCQGTDYILFTPA